MFSNVSVAPMHRRTLGHHPAIGSYYSCNKGYPLDEMYVLQHRLTKMLSKFLEPHTRIMAFQHFESVFLPLGVEVVRGASFLAASSNADEEDCGNSYLLCHMVAVSHV